VSRDDVHRGGTIRGLGKTYSSGPSHYRPRPDSAVEEREIFDFSGPNGAGKSTSIGILTTLVRPRRGTRSSTASTAERSAGGATPDRRGVPIRVLDYEFSVVEISVHARLWGCAPKAADARIASLLDRLGLTDRAEHGVRTLAGSATTVEIAPRPAGAPARVVPRRADSRLDPTTRAEIWRICRDLRDDEGVTVILTTHYLEEAETVCDRVGILHGGSSSPSTNRAAHRATRRVRRGVAHDRITTRRSSIHSTQPPGRRPALVAKVS